MTQKIRILTMMLLTLALLTAGIGGAVAAHAATTPAALAWSPTNSLGTYDYGTLATGATKSVTFTLTNAGGKATGSLRITLSGSSSFTITQNGCTGRSLGPNKSCPVPVQYAPKSSAQSESATLTASGKSASVILTLTGKVGVGGTSNLTLSLGRLLETVNGTNFYNYTYKPPSTDATQTFTVTNSGTSASKTLLIKCNDLPSTDCPNPFTINHDTCTNTSLAANGGSCTFDLEVTFSGTCQGGTPYSTELDMVGTDVTYITLFAYALCPG